MPSYVRLDPTDAQFVDVIHTDTQGYGTNRPMGHVDFYANGEGEQPGCGALNMFPQLLNQGMNATLQEAGTCSHSRSHQYFIESLQTYNKSSRAFCKVVAYQCPNYREVAEGKCINNCNPNQEGKCMFIGLGARQIANQKNVIMYFKTSNMRPYCLSPYRTYIDVGATSSPVLYTVIFLTIYDSKGAATTWTYNDGHPMPVQSRVLISTLVFSSLVLSSSELSTVNLHWNSRFYPFGLLRKTFVNGFIRVKSIELTTIDGKRIMLCPRGGEISVDVYEYEKVMFHRDACNKGKNASATEASTNVAVQTSTNVTNLTNDTKQ
ncbi:lipase member H-like [Arctopsyche grandis]|uniref:lipase member H-like n=1 Tax=Arctopsyche grandis TaxID=121162 RepID=UPI00406D8292